MTGQRAQFVTIDVFTAKRYKGNPLAVVNTTKSNLSHRDMQAIAREFNFSETVFLDQRDTSQPPRMRIYTPHNEINFAGHPVIGTGHVLFRQLLPSATHASHQQTDTLSLETNAGTVAITYDQDAGTVSADIPHNIHIHAREAPRQKILDTQPQLETSESAASMQPTYPTVSVVDGVTYVLVDLTSLPELWCKLIPASSPDVRLDEWRNSFIGTMFYLAWPAARTDQGTKTQALRVRMMAINLEDPACGSGCCTLAAYLALRDGAGDGRYRFEFDQGREIGRDSSIAVDITLDGEGKKVATMRLAGQAAPVTEGTMLLPYAEALALKGRYQSTA